MRELLRQPSKPRNVRESAVRGRRARSRACDNRLNHQEVRIVHAEIPLLHLVEIEAPDGAAALELERRLAHLTPTTVAHAGRWSVEVPAAESPDELEVVVREWLDEIGSATTTMRVNGRKVSISGRYAEHRTRSRLTRGDFVR
jgi:hypothetical protein